jgi:colanic acid/amylovoran biosynthesis glycosyltransferase
MTETVGIVTGSFPSPSETFVVNLVTGLVERGLDPRVFALSEGPSWAIDNREFAARTVEAPGLSCSSRRRWASVAPLVLANRRHLGRLGRVFAAMAGGGLPRSPRIIQAAALFLNAEVPPLLHCQFGPYGRQLVGLRDAGIVDARIITHFRGNDLTGYVRRHGPGVYDRLFASGDYFLAVSETLRECLLALGCPAERTALCRSGVDLDRFAFRPPPDDPPAGTVRLITIGRLVEKKGTEFALRAAALLRERGHDVTLDIVGEGKLRDRLGELIESLGVGASVRLVGAVPHDQVRDRLGAADICLAPSVTARDGDMEGLANSIKEAMAVGVPVVATDHGGTAELITDGDSGCLVAERDAAALADRVAWLIDNPADRRRMAAAARRAVEDGFDNRAIVADLVQLYRRLGG